MFSIKWEHDIRSLVSEIIQTWELHVKERIRSPGEQILSLKSSPLYQGDQIQQCQANFY